MKSLKRILATFILVMCFVAPVVAGPLEDATALENATDAYTRGDYATALQLYCSLAEHGDAAAQFALGVMYSLGQGVPQNYSEAVKWFRLAADQGNALAQNAIGAMYGNGKGVPQNFAEAAKWYRLAADQGNNLAQGGLGIMYVQGKGVPKDYVLAYMWFNCQPRRATIRRKNCETSPQRS